MGGRWPFTAEKIASRLALIAPHIHRRSEPLPHFRLLPLPGAMVDAPICHDPSNWEEVPHHSYWGHADLNFVLKSGFTVPDGWDAANIALHLPLGVLGDIFNHPEALVHVDTVPIGSADRYHHTVALDPELADGKPHVLSLHGWTGLAGWPPDPSNKAKLFMGTPALVERDPVLMEFYWLAQTALDTASTLDHDSDECQELLGVLDRSFTTMDTRAPIGDALHSSAGAALAQLKEEIPSAGAPLDVTLHGIGHAHMDIAYLWPVSQIRLKNARTYSNVLRLMDADPDYRFSHSQPQLYEMTAEDYPEIFAQIRERVAEGRWEVMGGMWVEPDLNIPGPEALIQQLVLGRSWFRDQFGDVETPVLWLPDTFGFPAQIPQLMKLAGLKWFVTNKLNWNQVNRVPWSTHYWEGLDGTRVLAHILTTPREVQYLPFPTNYKSDLSGSEVLGTWSTYTEKEAVSDVPICYGYGDGGGGPTEDLLAKARAYHDMPGMPRFRHSTVRQLFEKIEADQPDLPVWTGEHYMEGHRGVYTSQGWIKRANRKAEWALHEAEAMVAMAGLSIDLTEAWKLLCLNQFHDIVTGTSITQVFEDARRDFAKIMTITDAAMVEAGAVLDGTVPTVVNTAPVRASRLFLGPDGEGGQKVEGGSLCLLRDLPSYAQVPLSRACVPRTPVTVREEEGAFILENETLVVSINRNGQVTSVFEKALGFEVLAEGEVGNLLIAFEDRPICWDAWDIDPHYEDRREALAGDCTVTTVEKGPLRVSLEFTHRWRNSHIRQTIRLSAHSNRIDFKTEVDWHETHTLLKTAFPTRITSDKAKFDIQWGHVERSTRRDTPFDAARFEVPAQKWAAIDDGTHAVALLNDSKYGYDVHGGTLRLTLLKSSTSPDPVADQGIHHFTYSLLPYPVLQPEVRDAEAYDLNAPLRVLPGEGCRDDYLGGLVESLVDGVIIETVKMRRKGDAVVIRVFEARGRQVEARFRFGLEVERAQLCSIFETAEADLLAEGQVVSVALKPFQVASLAVSLIDYNRTQL